MSDDEPKAPKYWSGGPEMSASQLVGLLQDMIAKHGDGPISLQTTSVGDNAVTHACFARSVDTELDLDDDYRYVIIGNG